MTILKADYILTMDDDFTIIKDGAIVFDKTIIDVGEFSLIESRYPNQTITKLPQNSIIMPGLINPHIHLEFCANQTTLSYGNFVSWLGSVIKNRENLIAKADQTLMRVKLDELLKAGVTSVGAISSYGFDLEALASSKQKVVYFNEVLGSQPSMVDALYGDFVSRYESSKEYKSDRFFPAISVHSPYSTHPVVAKKALELAKKDKTKVQTHFMESLSERHWCDDGSGDFFEFFSSFLSNAKPVNKAFDYLEMFEGLDASFVHCNYAKPHEIDFIQMIGSIVHCPVSNKLLGNKRLDISQLESFALATDGLSSNISMSLFDEMRFALMSHESLELEELSKRLLRASTKAGSDILGLNAGEISVGKEADLIVFSLPDKIEDIATLSTQIILHTKQVQEVYIQGNKHA